MRAFRASLAFLFCSCVAILRGAPDPAWIATNEPYLEKLFDALDPDRPELHPALESWAAGERAAACAELVDYFRTRPPQLAGLAPTLAIRADLRRRADEFLAGRFDPLGKRVDLLRRADGGIDWDQRGPTQDKEFAWMLNRHLFFSDLLETHAETNDPRYASAVDGVVKDWIESNPYPNRLTFSSAWRALEVARRLLDAWGPYFDRLRDPAVLSDEALLLFLSSIPEHADALDEHASVWGGNHLVTEKIALALAGFLWPEFSAAEHWRENGTKIAIREILEQTYPDGAHTELSNHYHRVVLQTAQHLADLMELAGEAPPPEFAARLHNMWFYFLAVARPDGWGPLNNAADAEPNWALAQSTGAATAEIRRAVQSGTSQWFPWAGHAVFRDNWTERANWAFFDVGPAGTAHAHDDGLHLSVALEGRPFLVDAGRFTYRPGPWKDYFTGPASHNVLTLHGFARRPRPPRSVAPLPDPQVLADGTRLTQGEQWFDAQTAPLGRTWRQRRAVIHLPGAGFVVIDQMVGFGPVEITARWHFAPGLEREEIDSLMRVCSPQAPERTWMIGSPNPVGGWHSRQYGEKTANWELDERWKCEGPATLVWSIGQADVIDANVEEDLIHITSAGTHYTVTVRPETFVLVSASNE